MRHLFTFFLITAFLALDAAANDNTKTKPLKAYIVVSANRPVPEATIDLGAVSVAESIGFVVTLVNTTNQQIQFNRLEKACNCTELSPESGVVEPGGKLVMHVKLQAPRTPVGTRGGGRILFYDKDHHSLSVALTYGFPRYVGSPVRVLNVGFESDADTEEFTIPFHVGQDVKDDAFAIEAKGIDARFSYKVDRERAELRGTIELALAGKNKFNRLFGQLDIVNLGTGNVQSIPLILEREDAIRVHPRSIRFIQTLGTSQHNANVYIRCTKDECKDESCTVRAMARDTHLPCVVKRIGASVFRVEFALNEEQVGRLRFGDARQQPSKKQAELTITHGGDNIKRIVPYFFQGSE